MVKFEKQNGDCDDNGGGNPEKNGRSWPSLLFAVCSSEIYGLTDEDEQKTEKDRKCKPNAV